jgi:hypothetical protein
MPKKRTQSAFILLDLLYDDWREKKKSFFPIEKKSDQKRLYKAENCRLNG